MSEQRVTVEPVEGGWSIFVDGKVWTMPIARKTVFSSEAYAEYASIEWRGTILAGRGVDA